MENNNNTIPNDTTKKPLLNKERIVAILVITVLFIGFWILIPILIKTCPSGQQYYKEHNKCGPGKTACESSGGTIKLKEGNVVCCPNDYCSPASAPAKYDNKQGYVASEKDCSCTKSCDGIYDTLYDSTTGKKRDETYINEHGEAYPPLNCGFDCPYATNGYCTLDDPKIPWQGGNGATPKNGKLLCGKTNYENSKDNVNTGHCFSSDDYTTCTSTLQYQLICGNNGCGVNHDETCCPNDGSNVCRMPTCPPGTVYPCYVDEDNTCGDNHSCMSLTKDKDSGIKVKDFDVNIGYCVETGTSAPGTSSSINYERCINKMQIGEKNPHEYVLCPAPSQGYNLNIFATCAPTETTPCTTDFCPNGWQPKSDWAGCAPPGAGPPSFLCCDDDHKVVVNLAPGGSCPPAPDGVHNMLQTEKGTCEYCCPKKASNGNACLNTTDYGYSRHALGLPKAPEGAPAALMCSETDGKCNTFQLSPGKIINLNAALRHYAGLAPTATAPSDATDLFCDNGYCKAHCGTLETVGNTTTPLIVDYNDDDGKTSMCMMHDQKYKCGKVQTSITYDPKNTLEKASPVCKENDTDVLLWSDPGAGATATQNIIIPTDDTKTCTSNNACVKIAQKFAPFFGAVYEVTNTGNGECKMTADCLSSAFQTPYSDANGRIRWSKLGKEYQSLSPAPLDKISWASCDPFPSGYSPSKKQRGAKCRNEKADTLAQLHLLTSGVYCKDGVTVGGENCYSPPPPPPPLLELPYH